MTQILFSAKKNKKRNYHKMAVHKLVNITPDTSTKAYINRTWGIKKTCFNQMTRSNQKHHRSAFIISPTHGWRTLDC